MADWTAPKTRFRFVSAWDEILYLTDKIEYWLYSDRPDRRRALHFVPRLRRLLVTTAGVEDALPGAEGWIRVHEAEGDLERAIAVMLKRCRMYQKYVSIEGSPSFGRYDELADEYDWVGLTYDQIGNYVEAISWLERAQRLRRMYGVGLDAEIEEILDDARANLRRQQESCGFMVETNSEASTPDVLPFHRKAYVCTHVLQQARPVLLVTRPDGDWCLLCGHDDHRDDDYHVIGVGHVIERDPSINEVFDLDPGWDAERTSERAPWLRRRTL